MPSEPVISHNLSHRRTTGSSRLRENQPQSASGAAGRRRRSRSPDARVTDEVATRGETSNTRKKRKSGIAPNSAANITASLRSARDSVTLEEANLERGRKSKLKHRATSQAADEFGVSTPVDPRSTRGGKLRKKDRSRSREGSHRLPAKSDASGNADEKQDDARNYTGPLAQADFVRMRAELESAQQKLKAEKKAIARQSKEIEDLKQELAKSKKSHAEQAERLKVQTKKSDEIINNIEANLTCHICMEILSKPFGLSPCGHVLCQTCLQGWFRAAPPAEDEMYDDDMPEVLLYRKKTCPVCRTVVKTRPIPLFLIKSIASAIEKAKLPPGAIGRPSPPPDDDPWAGIFMDLSMADDDGSSDGDVEDDGEDDGEDDDEDVFDDDYDEEDDRWSYDGYGTPEEEESYEGSYVPAYWTPPTQDVSLDDYPFLDELGHEELCMLRRGATLQMIGLFSMTYHHETGLRAVVDERNIVYLGWNIALHPDDHSGEEYMDWICNDIWEREDRWEVEETVDGSWTAWRQVRDDLEAEYDTTDSEVWAAELALAADDEDDLM